VQYEAQVLPAMCFEDFNNCYNEERIVGRVFKYVSKHLFGVTCNQYKAKRQFGQKSFYTSPEDRMKSDMSVKYD